jgi:hypothetical protein
MKRSRIQSGRKSFIDRRSKLLFQLPGTLRSMMRDMYAWGWRMWLAHWCNLTERLTGELEQASLSGRYNYWRRGTIRRYNLNVLILSCLVNGTLLMNSWNIHSFDGLVAQSGGRVLAHTDAHRKQVASRIETRNWSQKRVTDWCQKWEEEWWRYIEWHRRREKDKGSKSQTKESDHDWGVKVILKLC